MLLRMIRQIKVSSDRFRSVFIVFLYVAGKGKGKSPGNDVVESGVVHARGFFSLFREERLIY